MQNNVRHLLDELYELEPLLKTKENEIVHIIDTMLKNRPKAPIDETLKKKLRQEIMTTFARDTPKSRWNLSLGSWFFPITTVAFALLFFSTISSSFLNMNTGDNILSRETASNSPRISFVQTIEKVGEKSFGDLASLQSPGVQGVQDEMGGEGGGGGVPMTSLSVSEPSTKMAVGERSMMPIETQRYNYIYTGILDIPEGKLSVYEKKVDIFSVSELSGFLAGFTLDGFDTRALTDTKITSLTLVEDKPFGYMFTADFAGGTLSLYQNYEKWPQAQCSPTGCAAPRILTEEDLPSDDALLDITDAFLTKYGVDTALYSRGQVDHSWKNWMVKSLDSMSQQTVPDSITITYPKLLIDSLIYEENGTPRGITLTYDMRNKRISSLSGLGKESLRASDYPVTTDKKLVEKLISAGGRYGAQMQTSGDTGATEKVIDIILGTPELAYMHVTNYLPNGKWTDYYVPALIFHVVEKPADVYIGDTITIPLIDEFMTVENGGGVMPYLAPAVGEMAR